MKPWALVTPASQGIGYQLARRILSTTTIPLVVTARKDIEQTKEQILDGLKDIQEDRLKTIHLDFLDESSISDAASKCSELFPKHDNYLHVAVSLPGILFPEKSPQQIDHDKALLTFRTNTLGPMMLLKHFSQFLPRKSTLLSRTNRDLPSQAVWSTFSARVGSISDNKLGGWYSYRASKAAVNQITKTFDNHLKTAAGENSIAIALHPGTVKTGLSKEFWNTTKPEKLFSADFAAEQLWNVIKSRNTEHRGRCYDWKGSEIAP